MSRVQRIEVRGVTRLFGGTPALRGVSVEFDAGTATVLEGPNGAGKSTLLGIVGTWLRPSAGTVHYAGVGGDRTRARSQIGWVAHESHCYPELSGEQNVQLAADLYGASNDGVKAVAARVEAQGFWQRPVRQLSRGQRQRIALARALVHQPSVLLLDEPWTGLDAASADRLEQIVREERERGGLIIVVSHHQGLAERLGAKRVRLERGRVAS